MSKKPSTIWLCQDCGNEFSTWSGECPACSGPNCIIKRVNNFVSVLLFTNQEISATLVSAKNTRPTFAHGGFLYSLKGVR